MVTSYLLATGGLMLLGGRLADLFGGAACSPSGSPPSRSRHWPAASRLVPAAALLAARVLQGVSAALLTPSALALLIATYDGARRATALSVWGGLAGGGVALGTVLGGVLTNWLGWRSVPLINVPVGLVALAAARQAGVGRQGRRRGFKPLARNARTRAPAEGESRARLDLPGAALAVGGCAALTFATRGTAGVRAASCRLPWPWCCSSRSRWRSGSRSWSGWSPLVPVSVFRSRGLLQVRQK